MAIGVPNDITEVQLSDKGLEAVSAGDRGKITSGFGDKKKVIILAVLGTVAAVVVIWQFVGGDSPKAAAASTTAAKAAGASAPSMGAAAVESALRELEAAAAKDEHEGLSVDRLEALVLKFNTYVQERQVPLAGLRVNPFEVSQVAATRAQQQTKDEQSDAQAEVEARRQRILATAAGLKLGAVLIAGTERAAMIGGKLYHVGDEVEGLRVVAIEPDGVTLVFEGERVSLRLRPDA